MRDAVLVWDSDGRVIHANPAAGRLWQAAPEALRGRRVTDLLPSAAIAADNTTGSAATDHVLAPDGLRPRRVRIAAATVRIGGADRRLAAIEDISRERESRDLLAQTLEQLEDAVLMVEADGRLARLNAAAERLWGQARDYLIDEDVAVLLPGGLPPADGPAREAVFSDGTGRRIRASVAVATIFLDDRILYAVFVRPAAESRPVPIAAPAIPAPDIAAPPPSDPQADSARPTAQLLEWRPDGHRGAGRQRETSPAPDATQATIRMAECGVPLSASLL